MLDNYTKILKENTVNKFLKAFLNLKKTLQCLTKIRELVIYSKNVTVLYIKYKYSTLNKKSYRKLLPDNEK